MAYDWLDFFRSFYGQTILGDWITEPLLVLNMLSTSSLLLFKTTTFLMPAL
jgi:hypothetical protein